jgi:hypothetical protein
MKDWTGNKTSVSSTLGASNLSKKERAERDYYATPPRALDAVIPYLDINIPIWECACGEGHLSNRLKELGYTVRESDIIERSYKCEIKDFIFFQNHNWEGNILTNPPFVYAKEFAEKGIETLREGRLLFLFLRVQFLESQKRRPLFEKTPPKYMLVYSKRTPQCGRNGNFEGTGNAAMYCWFIWEKGFTGDPIIKWI